MLPCALALLAAVYAAALAVAARRMPTGDLVRAHAPFAVAAVLAAVWAVV